MDHRNRSTVERLRDDLVKWIVAPSKAALERFLCANNLKDLLDSEPYPMSDHASTNYALEDGVDFIVDSQGEVLAGDLSKLREWRGDVARAAASLR